MALTHEENDLFTRVGPGTPAGQMMRLYWHPIGFAKELKDKPKRRRLLGEDLVLFRDETGRLGLLGLHCPHRGTSLEFGYIEDGGIRCCYHGWLYDVEGRCLRRRSLGESFLPIWVRNPRRFCPGTMCWCGRTGSAPLRNLYQEAIEAVQKGLDPLGVSRDPAKNKIIEIKPGEFVGS